MSEYVPHSTHTLILPRRRQPVIVPYAPPVGIRKCCLPSISTSVVSLTLGTPSRTNQFIVIQSTVLLLASIGFKKIAEKIRSLIYSITIPSIVDDVL